MRLAPSPANQHLTRLPYPIPHRTSHLSVSSTPLSIVDLGMMVPVAGLWVNVGTVMFANDAMVNTPWPTAPFKPTRGLSVPVPSLHPEENAVGFSNKVALQVAAPSCVNSVNSSLTVCVHWCWFPAEGWTAPTFSCFQWFLHVCIGFLVASAAASSLESFPHKSGQITPGSAQTSRSVFCNLRLGWSSEWVSCWFQPCFGLLKISHTEYALY